MIVALRDAAWIGKAPGLCAIAYERPVYSEGAAGDLASLLYLGLRFELALHSFGTTDPFLSALLLARNDGDLVAMRFAVRADGCLEGGVIGEGRDWMVWYWWWCLRVLCCAIAWDAVVALGMVIAWGAVVPLEGVIAWKAAITKQAVVARTIRHRASNSAEVSWKAVNCNNSRVRCLVHAWEGRNYSAETSPDSHV